MGQNAGLPKAMCANGATANHMVARPVPANLSLTTKAPSPINLEVLKVWLREYPDPKVAKFLIEGFTFGFRVRCYL